MNRDKWRFCCHGHPINNNNNNIHDTYLSKALIFHKNSLALVITFLFINNYKKIKNTTKTLKLSFVIICHNSPLQIIASPKKEGFQLSFEAFN